MSSLTRSPSGKWWVRWREPDGRQRTKTFDKQVHAKAFRTKLDNSILDQTYINPTAGDMTVKHYAEKWRNAQAHRPQTQAAVEQSFRLHVYPTLGSRRLADIRPTDLKQWAKGLEGQLAPSTIETISRYLGAVFNAAKRDRLIMFSPTEGWKRVKPHKERIVPPTPAEIIGIANEILPRYRPIVLTMAATGFRLGEACGVTAEVVDRDGPSISIDRQVVTIDNKPKFGPPKTEASYRTVPIPDWLLVELDAHVAEYGLGPDAAIFTNTKGDLVARHVIGAAWRTAVGRCGVKATPHDCRHAYASVLIDAGESVKVIQERMGHSSAKLTLDVYGHLWPSSDAATRAAVAHAYDGLMCSARVADPIDGLAEC